MYVVAEPNLKSMGKVLEKLVEWSQKAEMSSVNRRSLPSHIILINQCDPVKGNADLMDGNKTIRNCKNELANFNLPNEKALRAKIDWVSRRLISTISYFDKTSAE